MESRAVGFGDYAIWDNKKLGVCNIMIGHNATIHEESSRCCVIGAESTIPSGAFKCHVFGNNIVLSEQNDLTNCIYIGNMDQKIYISTQNKFASQIVEMDQRYQQIVDTINTTLFNPNTDLKVYVPNDGCFIDLAAKIQEMEKKIKMFEEIMKK